MATTPVRSGNLHGSRLGRWYASQLVKRPELTLTAFCFVLLAIAAGVLAAGMLSFTQQTEDDWTWCVTPATTIRGSVRACSVPVQDARQRQCARRHAAKRSGCPRLAGKRPRAASQRHGMAQQREPQLGAAAFDVPHGTARQRVHCGAPANHVPDGERRAGSRGVPNAVCTERHHIQVPPCRHQRAGVVLRPAAVHRARIRRLGLCHGVATGV